LGSSWGEEGANLASSPGQPVVNMGLTWDQPGVNLGSTRVQPGFNTGLTWGQPGVSLGPTRGRPGVSLGPTRGEIGDSLGSTWGQPTPPYLGRPPAPTTPSPAAASSNARCFSRCSRSAGQQGLAVVHFSAHRKSSLRVTRNAEGPHVIGREGCTEICLAGFFAHFAPILNVNVYRF